MTILPTSNIASDYSHLQPATTPRSLTEAAAGEAKPDAKLKEVFTDFVGQTFFQQMMSAMRKTVDKPAYFHGGRAEEVFQGQLDQVLSERMTEASAEDFANPMYELFMMARK